MNLDRTCYKCGTEFKLNEGQKATNICVPCRREYQKNYESKNSKVQMDGYKDNYPYDVNEKDRRFRQIQNQLKRMNNRSEWQQFFKDQLYKLETDDIAILKWIYDRRSQEAMAEDRIARNFARDEYEDTRETYKNKSWFD